MSLVARHLEANGIPTVIAGSALDVVLHCGAPRFVFTDFPLGNPCGKPWDRPMQRAITGAALDLLEHATAARALVETPYVWSDDPAWRDAYLYVDPAARDALFAEGERRRARQRRQKEDGSARSD